MSASKVFFTDFRCRLGVSQLDKLRKLLEKSEFSKIDFDGKFVAIKLHFGELGNLSFLRANYAKVVADFVKERGGKPFLTDCNTLYVGSRKNALEHMDTAYLNGYSPFSTGCHVIIADGLKGSDDIEVPVVGGEYCKTARIGRAVMDADIFISLAHFKGHEHAGFGGALKNIGMGCGSRAGKMAMHADGKPYVQTDLCVGCGACAKICAHNGPQIADKKCHIDHDACAGCGRCIAICPKDAIRPGLDSSEKILNCKITEYAKAVLDAPAATASTSSATSRPTATATRKTTCPSSPTSACLPPPTRSPWIWPAPRLSTASPSCRTAPSRTCSSSTTATASTPRMTTRTGRT